MVIAAIIYILVSILLMVGAAVFFAKALQILSRPDLRTQRYSSTISKLSSNQPLNRAETVEMLERQFHSSPSSDP